MNHSMLDGLAPEAPIAVGAQGWARRRAAGRLLGMLQPHQLDLAHTGHGPGRSAPSTPLPPPGMAPEHSMPVFQGAPSGIRAFQKQQ